MTILPKKKQNKNTSSQQNQNDDDSKDLSNDPRYPYSTSGTQSGPGTGQMSPNAHRGAWSSRASSEVDKRPAPDNGHPSMGPSHSKRGRHRTVVGGSSGGGVRGGEPLPNESLHSQRSLMSSVRCSMGKSSLNNSPSAVHSNSPRNSSPSEIDLSPIPGCSQMLQPDSEQATPGPARHHQASLLVHPVNFGSNHTHNHGHNHRRLEEDEDEDFSGYNSGDEYQKPNQTFADLEWEEKEHYFERLMKKKGFNIKKMCEDGACLFRAVADQVYGDQEMHSAVRKLCMDYMEKNGDYFSHYVTENFSDYIQRKRLDHIHGNHIEIQALSELFNRPVHVFVYSAEPINIQGCQKTDNEPIRLSYHRNIHYNSIVNPYKATIGVGLGLPAFKPGIADKSLMEKALLISEQHELEQAMLEDKIRATDWEATNEAIEEQIARESYIEWLRDNERRSRSNASKSTTASSTTTTTTMMNVHLHNADDDNTNNNAAGGGVNVSASCTSTTPSSPIPSPKRQSSYSPPYRTMSTSSPSATSSTATTSDSNIRCSPKRCNNTNNNTNNNDHIAASGSTPPNNTTTTSSNHSSSTTSFLHEVPASVFGLNDWDDTTDPIIAQVLAQSQAEYLESLKKNTTTNSATNNTNSTISPNSNEDIISIPSTSSASKQH